ncbi:hypothetical protein K458DRAFT_302466 [Lentithecium fluviatile CBS 122367]|uniref:Peptidase C14 caspase domain-containing protein n=1 Tax=Lentithecium fluviatile CBS 122367 TaxID=1168545 RepID=A0A6G1J2L8_9PLEO|nr:hypothetical protein K458DRAFT_302466 [Lentithecium fluviatile CBS 122367]
MPRTAPLIATPAISVLQPGDERESERQAWFQNVSNDILKIPNGYLKVAVLIIRWDREIDEFKGHDEEIARLESIFSKDFGYECKIVNITNVKKPQIALNCAMWQHVNDHDGPNNLLIVYYTGHGNQVENERLELAATTRKWVEKRGSYMPTAFWDEAEKPLLSSAEGDVLSILDCCFAASAAIKGRLEEFRTYQLLAASAPNSPTPGPGENSFTKALSDSLVELLRESKGTNFTVTKLHEKINLKRRTQSSQLYDRLQHFNRYLQLGRLDPTQERSASFQDRDPEEASLTLRLSLKVPELSKLQIETLAERLPIACEEARIPVRRIDWVKMAKAEPDADGFLKVAKAMNTLSKAMRRKSDAKKTKVEKQKLRGKKRTPTGSHSAPSAKRHLRERSSVSEMSSSSITSVSPASSSGAMFTGSSSPA